MRRRVLNGREGCVERAVPWVGQCQSEFEFDGRASTSRSQNNKHQRIDVMTTRTTPVTLYYGRS